MTTAIAETKTAAPLPVLASKINEAHAKCEQAVQSAVAHAVEAGELLLQAKSQCEHGGWLKWLETNTELPPRTAQMYMYYAREIPTLPKENAQRVAHLPLRAVGQIIRKAKGEVAKVQHKKDINDYAAAMKPTPTEDRKVQLYRHRPDREWTVEIGPNEAGIKLPERLEDLKQDDYFSDWQSKIDSHKNEATELRRQADRLEKNATNMQRELFDELREWLTEMYGPAHTAVETIKYAPLPVDLDERLLAMPRDEAIAHLLNCNDPDIVETGRGYWGDIRLMRCSATKLRPCASPVGWTKTGSMDNAPSIQIPERKARRRIIADAIDTYRTNGLTEPTILQYVNERLQDSSLPDTNRRFGRFVRATREEVAAVEAKLAETAA